MNKREQSLNAFFEIYRDVFNDALNENHTDIEPTAELFSSCFIAVDPSGVNCGHNDEVLRNAMIKGYAFYKSIGITNMEIISKKITLLDDFHSMVRIHWQSNYLKKDGLKGSIKFENLYFIQTKNDQHKVFAYITGDEQAALKNIGLI